MNSQLASNESSAIIATVDSVEDSALSVFSYSLDKYVPSHAFQKIEIDAVNSGTNQKRSGTLVYNLPKIAWLRSMYLQIDVGYTIPNDQTYIEPGGIGWLKLIERITFESATRELYTLSREAIQCMVSDLSAEAQQCIGATLHSTVDPLQRGIGNVADSADADKLDTVDFGLTASQDGGFVRVSIPLLFCTQYITKLCPALQFWEPSRCTVNLSSDWSFPFIVNCQQLAGQAQEIGQMGPVEAAQNINIQNTKLLCTFLQLPREQEQAVIADNYSTGNLTSLTFNTERITPIKWTLPQADAVQPVITIPIKSTKVISAIYLIVEATNMPTGYVWGNIDKRSTGIALNVPLPIKYLTFEANGEKIVNEVEAKHFSCYGRPTMSGEHGGIYATNPKQDGFKKRISPLVASGPAAGGIVPYITDYLGVGLDSFDAMNNCYVYKIDIGQLSANKTFSSGYLSLRELSNPRISFQMDTQIVYNSIDGTANVAQRRHGVEPIPLGIFASRDGATVPHAGASMKATVVLQTGALTTINGSDGRVLNVLSN